MSRHRTDARSRRHSRNLIFALLLLFPAIPLSAQQDSIRSQAAESRPAESAAADSAAKQAIMERIRVSSIRSSLLLQPMIVFRRGDERSAGFLLDVIEDSIYLRSRDEMLRIPLSDVMKLNLPLIGSSHQIPAHGALIGTYLIDLAWMKDESRPGVYADISGEGVAGFLLANLGSMTLCYFVLTLFESHDTPAMQFDFTADSEKRLSEEARFRAFTHGTGTDAKLHFTVQLSDVRPRESGRPERLIREAGLTPEAPSSYHHSEPDYPGSFNLFRKGQATWSIQPGYTVGAAYMDLTEPRYTEIASTKTGGLTHNIEIRQQLKGWYVVGTYEPMHARWNGPFSWLLGVGLGAAIRSGELTTVTLSGVYPNTVRIERKYSLASSLFSAFAFTDLRLYLYRSLSLALTGEYVFVNPLPVGSLEGITTTESTFDLSSWSWGLVLGVHF